jgi:glycosyltransferase involved in cell wall biosynthesis
VSIVVPAKDAATTIGEAVASAVAQGDVEVVVVDDGSTDDTAAVAEANGARVVRHPTNLGVAAARNRGIAEARAGLIAFCDADDVLLGGHVDAMLAVRGDDHVIVTANALWSFDGVVTGKTRHRGRFPEPSQQRRAILEANFVSTMSLFDRDLVDRIGGFADDLTHAEDWHFWMRAVFAGVVVRHQPTPLAHYRWGPGLSADTERMDAAVVEVLRRAEATLPLTDDERAYVRRRLEGPSPQSLLRTADAAVAAGRWSEAADAYKRAAELVPSDDAVVTKARLLRFAPGLGGRALRWQHRRADAARGGAHTRIR